MKRFIVISLLAALAVPSMACMWNDTHNNYLFSPYNPIAFSERVDKLTRDNWQAYLGKNSEYYYFDADEVIKHARKKGDDLMASYVTQLQKYLECADQKRSERWEYPTRQQMAARQQTLQAIGSYAEGKLKTRLRSQHALLLMRCNMMLGRHAENILFWQQTGSQLIESVYKDMMKNIYAGALCKTNREEEAVRLFAEQGDWESLMTVYYQRRSCSAIAQEYSRDANSPVLPFLLKDFVNNTQEAIDAQNDSEAFGGKLFIRNITKAEATQMCRLAARVVSEGKTRTPALWQNAKAWIEFLYGNRKQGVSDILAASKMEGTERMKDNTRVLMLYMTATQAPLSASFDNYLADELTWLDGKCGDGGYHDGPTDPFFDGARDRLIHQVLAKKYERQPITCLALLKALCSFDYDYYVDTMRTDRLLQYIDYVRKPAKSSLEKFLKPRQKFGTDAMNDLVGTKYLRQCRWQEAASWLQKVPAAYYSQKSYAPYAANRKWTVEPWVKRQWLSNDAVYGDHKWQLKSNPKLDFARDMLQTEAELQLLTGGARQRHCYELAVRYAQAHFTGDCWFIMRDVKSCSDEVRSNETNLARKALSLLEKASLSTDIVLKERALFAMAYSGLYDKAWYSTEWDDKTADMVRRVNRQTANYRAFAALADYEKQNATRTSQYVSRCDDYKQFCKTYRK